ncbi:MAG: hypothetical protein LBJ36_05035 [Synergistaceae bacterium]|nr:hypothetical protein [Synergistaceae bacterium]
MPYLLRAISLLFLPYYRSIPAEASSSLYSSPVDRRLACLRQPDGGVSGGHRPKRRLYPDSPHVRLDRENEFILMLWQKVVFMKAILKTLNIGKLAVAELTDTKTDFPNRLEDLVVIRSLR